MDTLIVVVAGRAASEEVLVEATHGRECLPAVAVAPDATPGPTELPVPDIVDRIEGRLGLTVVPLRILRHPGAGEADAATVVVEIEPLAVAPPGFRWADGRSALESIEPSVARSAVERQVEPSRAAVAPLTPPWASVGWQARAGAWMGERLAAAGMRPLDPPRLAYQSPLAAVLMARTERGRAFLKCAPPAFAHEASLTGAIARRTPDMVPDVIAIDAAENWLLMHDLGSRVLGDEPEPAWPDGLRRVAALQRAWIGATAPVVEAGGPHRPVARLADALPGMLDEAGLGSRMPPEVRRAWIAATPRLGDACRRLDALGLPETLVHGDMHPWNIAVTDRGLVVFDWSDGAVGNPFVDLAVFLRRTKDLQHRRVLRDAYIEAWDGVLGHDRLVAGAELAMCVGAVYQVATYQALLPAMDPPDRAAFDGADVRWAQRALDGLEHGLDAIALT